MLSDSRKISIRQAVLIFLTITFTPSIRLIPTYAAQRAKQAAWLSPIISTVLLLLLGLVWQVLYKRYKDCSLMEIYCDITGSIAGRIIAVIYLLWMILLTALYIRYFAIRLVGAIYPNTSISIFTISMLVIVTYTLRFGLPVLARFNEVVLPFLVLVFFLLFLMMIPNIKTEMLTPVSLRSILPVVRASVGSTGILAYFTFIFIFGNRINNKESIKKSSAEMSMFLTAALVLIQISILGTFGYRVAQRTQLPFLVAVKQISVMNIFEKVESIVVSVWVLSDFVIISFFITCALSILGFLLKLRDTKPLISIYVIFSYFLCMLLANNVFEMEKLSDAFAIPGNIILGFVIPAVMLLVGKIRRKV